jgi:hypothetical protein
LQSYYNPALSTWQAGIRTARMNPGLSPLFSDGRA